MTTYDLIRRALESERLPVMHPNGFIQFDISEAKDRSKRLHVWPEWSDVEKPEQGHFTIHDHAFSFDSEVLCGQLVNVFYPVFLQQYGPFEMWRAKPDRQEAKGKRIETGRTGSMLERTGYRVGIGMPSFAWMVPGERYDFEHGIFHDTITKGLTATVMTKTFVSDERPRVLCIPESHPESFIERIDHSPEWMMEQIMESLSRWGALV